MSDPTEITAVTPPDEQDTLLDALGALREQRAAETLEDFPLPGFAGRLWARFRLPQNQAKATQLSALMVAGHENAAQIAVALLTECTVGLFLMTDPNAEPPDLRGRREPRARLQPPSRRDGRDARQLPGFAA
jgi:hypothetical protein